MTTSQASHHSGNGGGAVGGNTDCRCESHQSLEESWLSRTPSLNDNDLLMSSLRYHSTSLANLASLMQSNNLRHRLSLDNNNESSQAAGQGDDPPVMIMMPASALATHFANLNNANFLIAFPSVNMTQSINEDSNNIRPHTTQSHAVNDNIRSASHSCSCRCRRT